MMRNRTMTPPARRRPTLNFDLLECRQMLNASPITQQHTFVLEQQAFLRDHLPGGAAGDGPCPRDEPLLHRETPGRPWRPILSSLS